MGVDVPEVVARVDDEVGLVDGEPAHPVLLLGLPRGQVQVAEVQDRERPGARLEDGEHLVSHGEPVALDEAAPGEGTQADGRARRARSRPSPCRGGGASLAATRVGALGVAVQGQADGRVLRDGGRRPQGRSTPTRHWFLPSPAANPVTATLSAENPAAAIAVLRVGDALPGHVGDGSRAGAVAGEDRHRRALARTVPAAGIAAHHLAGGQRDACVPPSA